MFSPDGKLVVTASDDGTARLWEAASGRSLHTLKGHTDYVNGAVFCPDGKLVVTASIDGTARLWAAAACTPSKATPASFTVRCSARTGSSS